MKTGAKWGVILGLHGWVIGFGLVCASAGAWDLLGTVLLTGWPLTIALTAATLWVAEVRPRGRAFAGMILLTLGALTLAVSHIWAPLIDAEPKVRDALLSLGSVYRLPDVFPLVMFLASAALFWRSHTQTGGRTNSDDSRRA